MINIKQYWFLEICQRHFLLNTYFIVYNPVFFETFLQSFLNYNQFYFKLKVSYVYFSHFILNFPQLYLTISAFSPANYIPDYASKSSTDSVDT